MILDYPLLRARTECPICHRAKKIGVVTCWQCYHWREGRYGFDASDRAVIDAVEAMLNERDPRLTLVR